MISNLEHGPRSWDGGGGIVAPDWSCPHRQSVPLTGPAKLSGQSRRDSIVRIKDVGCLRGVSLHNCCFMRLLNRSQAKRTSGRRQRVWRRLLRWGLLPRRSLCLVPRASFRVFVPFTLFLSKSSPAVLSDHKLPSWPSVLCKQLQKLGF